MQPAAAPFVAFAPAARRQFVLYAGFVLTGIVTVMLGPLLPYLASLWGLSDAQAGTLFTAQFLGSMAGVAMVTPMLRAKGFRRTLAFGYAVMAAGVVLFAITVGNAVPWTRAAVAVVCFGAGLGIVIPASNLCVAAVASAGRSSVLNRLNAAWGAGAVACAPLWGLCLRNRVAAAALAMLGGLIACAAACLLSGKLSGELSPSSQRDAGPSVRLSLLVSIAISVLLFVYVGTETSLAGWAATYVARLRGRTAALAAPSLFWATLTAGRLAAPSSLRRMSESRLLNATVLLTLAGALLLTLAARFESAILALVVTGFGLAPVYPLLIGMFSRLGEQANRSAGPVFAAAGLGGAILPWTVGVVSTSAGQLRLGLLVPVAGCLVLFAVYNTTDRLMARMNA